MARWWHNLRSSHSWSYMILQSCGFVWLRDKLTRPMATVISPLSQCLWLLNLLEWLHTVRSFHPYIRMTPQLGGLVASHDKLNTLCLYFQKTYVHQPRQGADLHKTSVHWIWQGADLGGGGSARKHLSYRRLLATLQAKNWGILHSPEISLQPSTLLKKRLRHRCLCILENFKVHLYFRTSYLILVSIILFPDIHLLFYKQLGSDHRPQRFFF